MLTVVGEGEVLVGGLGTGVRPPRHRRRPVDDIIIFEKAYASTYRHLGTGGNQRERRRQTGIRSPANPPLAGSLLNVGFNRPDRVRDDELHTYRRGG